jgi:DNA repair protein RadD
MFKANDPPNAKAARACEGASGQIKTIDSSEPKFTTHWATEQAASLHDDQLAFFGQLSRAVAEGGSVLAVAPTGSGKTVCFSFMAGLAARNGYRVLILCHRAEILAQTSAALAKRGIQHGLIVAGSPDPDDAVVLASIDTFARRAQRYVGAFHVVFVDEAHHAVSSSWKRTLGALNPEWLLGFTATPERLDGRGLGDVFDHMVVGAQTGDLIARGRLSRFRVFAPERLPDLAAVKTKLGDFDVASLRNAMVVVTGAAVAEFKRLASGERAIAFCVDVAHSKAVAAAFNAAGVRAMHVDGDTPAHERRGAVAALAAGELDVLTNVAIFGEGVDVPAVGAAILLRPTQSLALHLQQIGRALRTAPGKDEALILDFAGNTLRHGLPDEPRQWALHSAARKDRPKTKGPTVRRCRECGTVNSRHDEDCRHCGASLIVKPPPRVEVDVRLRHEARPCEVFGSEVYDRLRGMSYGQRLQWAGDSEQRLRAIAKACGYKPGWVYHRIVELRGAAQ